MRCLAVLCCVAATVAGAQQPTPPPSPPPPDSARAESALAPPPPPSPEQKRFVDGLRTATRGIAQLKDGLNRVTRTQAKRQREPTTGRAVARRPVRQRARLHGTRASLHETGGLRGFDPTESAPAHRADG